ncbi:ribonuclease H family protein [Georgenia deserti]|uniref:ribonuclease H n=1 Tax=Georgenia deserti TaxID=2093781 RepID=A0ABW4L3Z5_9MICO
MAARTRTWSTQTELGKLFGLTAREVGTHLTALGLKAGPRATERAVTEDLAAERTLRDGTPFFVWHTERVRDLLASRGLQPRTEHAGGGESPARQDPPPRATDGYDRVIATDGSALGNPGPTGWAWVDQRSAETGSGGLAHGTNNIGELIAVREALRHAGPEGDLLIRADSQYVINVVTSWAPGWRRRGWRKGDGKAPENLELVKEILDLVESRTGRTDFEWVRGHAGDEHNERADELAVAAAQAVRTAG